MMDYDARRLFERLGSISSPKMGGDNLAILLCGYFDNPDQEDGENGWTPDAVAGCDEVLDAIRAHFQPLADAIADLRARNEALRTRTGALADALKPFAEAAENIDDNEHDRWEAWEHSCAMAVSLGDFRNAYHALAANREG